MEEKEIQVWQAKVLANEKKAQGIYQLTLSCPNADSFKLGQFICLEPLHQESVMSRPFSIYVRDLPKNTVSLLYKAVGRNTVKMSQLQPGQEIKAWGPLGRVTRTGDLIAYQKVYLVGGGIGIAALCQWQHVLYSLKTEHEVFYGNKVQAEAVRELDLWGNVRIHFATDDGSDGYHGLVTDLFEQKAIASGKTLVVTCGPKPMMKRVAEICDNKGMDCWVSLERIMACGIRVCLGCSVKMKSGQKHICHDGPVFDAMEVEWDALG